MKVIGSTGKAVNSCRLALSERSLTLSGARPADASVRSRVDAKVRSRKRVTTLAASLGREFHVLRVANHQQMVWIPAGVHAAPVVQLHAGGNRAA
jgi:hypothetical protein